jgi:hypothetical protein
MTRLPTWGSGTANRWSGRLGRSLAADSEDWLSQVVVRAKLEHWSNADSQKWLSHYFAGNPVNRNPAL